MNYTNARDYQEILQHQFELRLQANSQYSLRAYARDLRISDARLSRILNYKEGLSEKSARSITKHLSLNEFEKELFCLLVLEKDARSKKNRLLASKKVKKIQEKNKKERKLLEDEFHLVSDWYYIAILHLTELSNFQADPSWIAKRLGVKKAQVQIAITRLLRLKVLTKENNTLKKNTATIQSSDGIPSEAIRKFNRQILDKAKIAIDKQNIRERILSTVTLAISAKDLPEITREISSIRKKFNQKISRMSKGKDLNDVYCFSTQFFKLSEGNHEE